MRIMSGIAALVLACAALITPAAAETAEQKAEGAIGGYMAILALVKVCNLDIPPPATEAIIGNVNALQKKSKTTDATLDATLKQLTETFTKANGCKEARVNYLDTLTTMASETEKLANGSGVALKPVPFKTASAPQPAPAAAPAAPSPKEAAKNMLMLALMLEAISDECKIELTSREVLNLDRTQYFYRAKADFSAKDFKAMSEALEEEVKKSRDKFCAPSWGFKPALKSMIESIQ